MAQSLRPCPMCGKLMEVRRKVCAPCQEFLTKPLPRQAPFSLPEPQPNAWNQPMQGGAGIFFLLWLLFVGWNHGWFGSGGPRVTETSPYPLPVTTSTYQISVTTNPAVPFSGT